MTDARRRIGTASLFAGGAASVGLIVAAIFDPKATAAGWLVGFTFCSQVLIGSLLLLMIHRLTSGRWGEIIAPALLPAALSIPLLFLLVIPLLVAMPSLFPWYHHAAPIKSDVIARYLNAPFFIVRTLIALAGWSMLALVLPRVVGPRGQLLAALGLAFHCIAVSVVAVDWYLSLEAPFTSSSFGASVGVIQLIAAMAWALVLAPETDGDPAIADLGGLFLAFLLGITYIDFMAVLVIWYGDLPREEIWFVEREGFPWSIMAAAAFVLVSVVPVFSLMLQRLRSSRTAARALGAGVLLGLALYDVYLIAPPFGVAALLPSALALGAIGLALTGWMLRGAQTLLYRARPAHVA